MEGPDALEVLGAQLKIFEASVALQTDILPAPHSTSRPGWTASVSCRTDR